MYGVEFGDEPFAYAIFGCQYIGEAPTEPQASQISKFDELITPAAGYIDKVIQDGPFDGAKVKTQIWLSYWATAKQYEEWFQSAEVQRFWSALPPDAGMWREVAKLPGGRAQFGTNKDVDYGLGAIGKRYPYTDKMFYWGCYRDRLKEATSQNRLATSHPELPTRGKKSSPLAIRLGRTKFTSFPENLCLVIEGQDHSRLSDFERDHWFEKFDDTVTEWMKDLVEAGPEKGILDARVCYSDKDGNYRNKAPAALNPAYKLQIFWFHDFRYMEKIGRSNITHRGLRDNFMASYCPAGPMAGGDLLLWVETSIAKSKEMDVEYVGCLEGTGFMAYDHAEPFVSEQTDF